MKKMFLFLTFILQGCAVTTGPLSAEDKLDLISDIKAFNRNKKECRAEKINYWIYCDSVIGRIQND